MIGGRRGGGVGRPVSLGLSPVLRQGVGTVANSKDRDN